MLLLQNGMDSQYDVKIDQILFVDVTCYAS